jgi:hypothetical protein
MRVPLHKECPTLHLHQRVIAHDPTTAATVITATSGVLVEWAPRVHDVNEVAAAVATTTSCAAVAITTTKIQSTSAPTVISIAAKIQTTPPGLQLSCEGVFDVATPTRGGLELQFGRVGDVL